MLNLLLILGFAGMIVISAGFAGVTFLQGVQSTLDAQITTQRLLDVATQVQTHARYIEPQATGTLTNYMISLPMGTNGAAPYAYSQVPIFVTSSARSANGVPFEYCPYATANQSGTATTVTMASGTTYNLKYTSNTDTNSQNYVTDSNGTSAPTNSSANAMGFLVAAAPNKFYPPDCSAIKRDSSNVYTIASGGIVAVIANDFFNKMKVPSAMTDFRFYVSQNPSGDGSGRDSSNFITLADALTIIKNVKPASATIYVDSAACTATGTTFPCTADYDSGGAFSYGTRIFLASATGNAAVEVTGGSITLDEYSMLSLGKNITLQIGDTGSLNNMTVNGTLEMADNSPTLTAGTIQVYGGAIKGFLTTMNFNGNVTVDGSGVITSSGPMIFNNLGNRGFKLITGHLYGGTTMNFNPAASGIVPINIRAGGDLIAGSGAMTIGTAGTAMTGGMVIDPGGRFMGAANTALANSPSRSTTASTVLVNNVSGYGFYVHGEMDLMPQKATGAILDYANLPAGGLSAGIVLASGGKFMLNGGAGASAITIGDSANRPVVGIQDNGGSGFFTMNSSNTNIVYSTTAGACWAYNNVAPTNIANLFSDSLAGTTNGNSAATQTVTFPSGFYRLYNNSANLTCQRT